MGAACSAGHHLKTPHHSPAPFLCPGGVSFFFGAGGGLLHLESVEWRRGDVGELRNCVCVWRPHHILSHVRYAQLDIPVRGGLMEAMVLGCPGRPCAMLALRDAKRVGRSRYDWGEERRCKTAWMARRRDSRRCRERERERERDEHDCILLEGLASGLKTDLDV